MNGQTVSEAVERDQNSTGVVNIPDDYCPALVFVAARVVCEWVNGPPRDPKEALAGAERGEEL